MIGQFCVRCTKCNKSLMRMIREDGTMKPCSCGGAVVRTSRFNQRIDTQKRQMEKYETH